MEKLNLNKGEKETIECYMAGIGFTEQAKLFALNLYTIWRRRKSAQMKYLSIAEGSDENRGFSFYEKMLYIPYTVPQSGQTISVPIYAVMKV